ncbi:MAG: hypothetical protein ABIK31_07000 [candidate division WOR-3 bacterium]
MKQTLLIGLSDDQRLQSGQQSWTGRTLEEIKKLFDLSNLTVDNLDKSIAYFSKTADKTRKCVEINITSVTIDSERFAITFTTGQEINLTAEQVKKKAQRILRSEKILPTNAFMPFCTILNEVQTKKLIKQETLIEEVNELIKKSDWISIYKKFEPIQNLKNNSEIWNDEDLLIKISFATAKLSEVYIDLRRNFQNEQDKNKFLAQQKKYRKATELLRHRCIEINPTNPLHYSNLGYSHYQYVRTNATWWAERRKTFGRN